MRLLASICAVMLISGGLVALEISVAPKTLVLSSADGSFTVHTGVPFWSADDVTLAINGATINSIRTFADDCGNLVVQCRKDAVIAAIGDFQGKTTKAEVTLVVDGDLGSEEFYVKR